MGLPPPRCWTGWVNMPCTHDWDTIKGTSSGVDPVTVVPVSIRDTLCTRASILPPPSLHLNCFISRLYLPLSFLLYATHCFHTTTNPSGSSFYFLSPPPFIAFYGKSDHTDGVFQHDHEISHPMCFFTMRHRHSSHWRVEFMFPPHESGSACNHRSSNVTWLPRLGHKSHRASAWPTGEAQSWTPVTMRKDHMKRPRLVPAEVPDNSHLQLLPAMWANQPQEAISHWWLQLHEIAHQDAPGWAYHAPEPWERIIKWLLLGYVTTFWGNLLHSNR